jgi:hypothetical protein
MAGELLALAAKREARQIDEKLFLETCATPLSPNTKTSISTTAMSILPFMPPFDLASRSDQFRTGINLGDILIEGDDILGDGVNVAAVRTEAASYIL